MIAVKTENTSSVGKEKPTSCFLAGIRFKLNVLILLYFLLTQRQYELMHLRFLHWTPVALKKSIFDLNRNMNITIWRKKKKTLCVNSSMNLITAVCAHIE